MIVYCLLGSLGGMGRRESWGGRWLVSCGLWIEVGASLVKISVFGFLVLAIYLLYNLMSSPCFLVAMSVVSGVPL